MKALLALGLLVGCTGNDAGTQTQHLPRPTNPTFTLLVSNQSFDLPTVDIEIRIDNRLAVTGEFDVDGQHTWIPFDFDLAPGNHEIAVTSEAGDTSFEQAFLMDDRKWAVINFWYYSAGSPEPTPQQFSFHVFDEQPAFD
jgi:hypothetical protein